MGGLNFKLDFCENELHNLINAIGVGFYLSLGSVLFFPLGSQAVL